MAEGNDCIIDLTSDDPADYNVANNVARTLDPLRGEENRQSNHTDRARGGAVGVRKRIYSTTTPVGNIRVTIHNLCTPDNKKRRTRDCRIMRERPEEKKDKKSLGHCPICYDDYSEVQLASTLCGHVFCVQCLKRALRSEHRCPICCTKLKGKSAYHALFL